MCRLLGYAAAGGGASLADVLGPSVASFRNLSEIHNDGWGVSMLTEPSVAPHMLDGGEPSPEIGTSLYRNTQAARHDPLFPEFADIPARSALWHLRLASSHQPLIIENQQPFHAAGTSFIHNGDLSDETGVNVTRSHVVPINPAAVAATGGRSDSAVYFAAIREYVGFGFSLPQAVSLAIRYLRHYYPQASYNCMIQSGDLFVAAHACGTEPQVEREILDIYTRYGRAQDAPVYRDMRYKTVFDASGTQIGVVAASTGFDEPAAEGWHELDNNHMIIASNRTGKFRVAPL
ncbi:class II glutamine amidotransferase [Bifidobacterium magnum]|uniref:Glutamine amidotransferase n=1 Tax=Bifidobacterium magnum TaxID=1692 RepID=A0A087B831_9BIFI|nr:glutamine amidotransferase [Bifidobacterium magnum]KFI67181.1 Glutamine amidotransferase [Bifidobacterium magnum]